MGFVNRMSQKVPKYMTDLPMKKWWLFPFAWMVDVVLQGVRALYRINKDENVESLSLLGFRRDVFSVFFLIYSKEADCPRAMQEFKISYQMFVMMTQNNTRSKSEHKRIQNFLKHLKMEGFVKTVNG